MFHELNNYLVSGPIPEFNRVVVLHCGMEELVPRLAHTQKVDSSNLSPASIIP